MFFLLAPLFLTLACSHRDNVSYKDDVKKALEQADLKDVTVSENQDKNTITLGGKVHSNDAKLLFTKLSCGPDSRVYARTGGAVGAAATGTRAALPACQLKNPTTR